MKVQYLHFHQTRSPGRSYRRPPTSTTRRSASGALLSGVSDRRLACMTATQVTGGRTRLRSTRGFWKAVCGMAAALRGRAQHTVGTAFAIWATASEVMAGVRGQQQLALVVCDLREFDQRDGRRVSIARSSRDAPCATSWRAGKPGAGASLRRSRSEAGVAIARAPRLDQRAGASRKCTGAAGVVDGC